MFTRPMPAEERLRRAIVVRRLLDEDGSALHAAIRTFRKEAPKKPTLLERLGAAFRSERRAEIEAILKISPVHGADGPWPLDAARFARFETVAAAVVAQRSSEAATPEAALSPRAVALHLALYAQLAVLTPETTRWMFTKDILATCGLWQALRAAGQADGFSAASDATAHALAMMAAGSPYVLPLALSQLKTNPPPRPDLLAPDAELLAATLPDKTLARLSHHIETANDPLFSGDGWDQEQQALKRAIKAALPEEVGRAVMAEHERRFRLRVEDAIADGEQVLHGLRGAGHDRPEPSMDEIMASIRRIISDDRVPDVGGPDGGHSAAGEGAGAAEPAQNQSAGRPEPSMEDILASVRRIVHGQERDTGTAPRRGAHEGSAPADAPIQHDRPEPSMDEILARIRRIVHEHKQDAPDTGPEDDHDGGPPGFTPGRR